MWDAHQYLKFSNERSRAFLDLLSQVQPCEFKSIADLGCGPGLLTPTLAERWPMAQVVGVDNAPAMLQQARKLAIPDRLHFVEADLAESGSSSVRRSDRQQRGAALGERSRKPSW